MMLKSILTVFILFFIQSAVAVDSTGDALGLAGIYRCYGYDMHDGAYKDATATMMLDKKDSDFKHNFGAYHFILLESTGTKYVGEAAASGNELAIYFKNTSQLMQTDQGVGIATVSYDRDTNGNSTTSLHKFYYEPSYQGGGNGYETCIKQP